MNEVEKSEHNGSFDLDFSKDAREISTQLSELYRPLAMKAYYLVHGLFHHIFDPRVTCCNKIYRWTADGTCHRNCYPLPLITVRGYCELEIDFHC